MRIALEPEQLALKEELQGYFADLVTPEVKAGLASATGEFGEAGVYKGVIRQLGTDGWLGIGWPEEYGGQNRSMIEQLIFTDVAADFGVPIPYLTLNTVGPTIMRYGTDEQKADFLPKILAGDLHFSIGYSEPGSGTDLASLKTKAVREGDEFVINGQKMWTSLIQYADWIWLACRTDPGPAAAQGPLDDPGPGRRPRLLVHPGAHGRRRLDERDLLRGRPGPGGQPGRRAQRRLVADDQPAQPRAGLADVVRAADACRSSWSASGRRRPRTPTATG